MENKESEKIGIYDECVNSYVYNLIPKKVSCLDVGCWTGNLGKELIKEKNCIVDGVDFSDKALREAKKIGYRNTYNINLNCNLGGLDGISEKYDCIICADALEHLENPNAVLKKLKKNIKEDGIIIISTPNIAFIKQRVDLLLGKFDYNPNGGIMDKTHLRFFTKKSILRLLKEEGFEVIRFSGYSLVKNKFFFLRTLADIYPTLFAIQFLIKVRKNER